MILHTEEFPSAHEFSPEHDLVDPIESIAELLERVTQRVTDTLES